MSDNWWHKKGGVWQITDTVNAAWNCSRSATGNESLLLDRITDQEIEIERLKGILDCVRVVDRIHAEEEYEQQQTVEVVEEE